MKRFTLLPLLWICIFSSVRLFADTEPDNNTLEGADAMTLDVPVNGAIDYGTGDLIDYYVFNSGNDGNISLNLTSDIYYVYIKLLDSAGVQVGSAGNYSNVGLTVNGLAEGIYYAKVEMYTTSSGSYELTSSVAEADYTNDTEPNNIYSDAIEIDENSIVEGHIGYRRSDGSYDTDDWYVFESTEDGDINLLLTNLIGKYNYIYLYDNDGFISFGIGGGYGSSSFTKTGLAAGTYYARIQYYSTSEFCGYTFTNTVTPTVRDNDAEPNDDYTQASVTIAANDSVFGHIGHRINGGSYDTDDWYIVDLPVDGDINLLLTNPAGKYNNIFIYDNDGTTSLGSNAGYGTSSFTKTGLAAGTYYARVQYYSSSEFSGYKLQNLVTPANYASDVELNDLYTEASVTIPENDSVFGHIGYRRNGGTYDTDDWYKLELTEDGAITLKFTNSTGHYQGVYLYDDDGTTSLGNNFNFGTATITVSNLAAGSYYAKMDNYSTTSYSAYKLEYIVTPTAYSSDVELNDLYTEATVTIPENDSVFGHIGFRRNGGSYDTDDWYLLELTQDGQIQLKFTSTTGHYQGIYLYDNNGITSLGNNFGYGSAILTVSNLAAGSYYAKVDNYATTSYLSYKLEYLVTPNPYDNDPEPNDSLAIATPMLTNSTVEGHIGYRWNGGAYDVWDYYELNLSESGSLTVSIEKPGTIYNTIYILNSAGTSIESTTGYGNQSITEPALVAGTYYARVHYYSSSDFTGYALTNTYCPDAITIVAEGETTLCEGESVILTTPDHHWSYLWNDGSTTETNAVTLTGDFSLTIDNGDGCVRTSNTLAVDVTPNPVALLEADGPTTFCEGGSVTITANVPGTPDSYLWSNGETTSSITVSESGDYSVTVFKNDCSAISDPIAITVNANPTATITPDGPTTFCEGGDVMLTANTSTEYLWSNGETTQSITVTESGDYSVTITNTNGCTDESSATSVTVNSIPVATISAGGDTEFCDGGSVMLTASAGDSYLWSNGQTSASISATSEGSYSVTVTENGCSATSANTDVTVNPNPEPVISADGPTTFCEGGSVNLSVDSFFDIFWSTGATTESINVSESGLYNVTVTDANGCMGTSSDVSVTTEVCTELVISADGPTEFCEGGSVMLTSNEESGNLWSTGETTQSITVTESGDYSCVNGDNTSNTITVTVNPNPTPEITADGPTTFCEGGSVNLSVDSFFDIFWSTGATTESINVTESGSYSVIVTDANGCSGEASAVEVTAEPCGTEVTIDADGPTTFCEGGSVVLTSSEATGNMWSTGETTQSITVTASGDYTCSNGEFESNTITVTVVEEASVSVAPVGPDKICFEGSVLLTATATSGDIQWQRNGMLVIGETGTTLSVTIAGNYSCIVDNGVCDPTTSNSVKITYYKNQAITPSGISYICPGSSVVLSVDYNPTLTYQWYRNNEVIDGATSNTYEATTPGNYKVVSTKDGCGRVSNIAQVKADCRLASELEIESQLWPNPASESFNISTTAEENAKLIIQIYDISGSEVYALTHTQTYTGEILNINLPELASGMYSVVIRFPNGTMNQHPLVINK